MDCILLNRIGRCTFKTGKSAFDQRQALVLFAGSSLSTKQQAVASFYNLERCTKSALIGVLMVDAMKTSWAWWLKAPARFAQLPAESQSVQPNFPPIRVTTAAHFILFAIFCL